MRFEEAAQLQEDWAAKGSPPCDHPKLAKKRSPFGSWTGDKVCTTCGEDFQSRDWKQMGR